MRLDEIGRDWTRSDEMMKLDESGQAWTRLDKIGQERTKLSESGQDWTRFDESGPVIPSAMQVSRQTVAHKPMAPNTPVSLLEMQDS